MSFAVAPWHMWGTTQTATVVSGAVGPANATVSAQQLARVNYRRPENWRFLFTGKLIAGDVGTTGTTSLHALFDLYVGLGRSRLDTEKPVLGVPANFNAFCRMRWDVPTGVVPGQQNNNMKYAARVPGPPLDDTAPTVLHLIDMFPAEDIACRVRLVMSAGDPGVSVTAELGAYFAPNVHVRPEWFREEFVGNELRGT